MNDAAWNDHGLEANRRYLCAELARIRALLGRAAGGDGAEAEDTIEQAGRESDAARARLEVEAPVDLAAAVFGLTAFERDVLLLAAGYELDAGIGAACAGAAGRRGQVPPSFSTALAALPGAHWSALLPERPLRRWRLIELDPGQPLTQADLRIDERILHFIAGINVMDARLVSALRPLAPPSLVAPSQRRVATALVERLGARGPWPVVQLVGDDADGREDVAALVAAQLGWSAYVVSGEEIPTGAAERAAFATLWTREAALLDAVLLIEAGAADAQVPVDELAGAIGGPLFVGLRDPRPLRRASLVETVHAPQWAEQRELWRRAIGGSAADSPGTVERLSSPLRLSARAIERLAPAIREGREPVAVMRGDVRARAGAALGQLAARVESVATWEDLVVPDATRALLREVADHVRHRGTVYDQWGFAARATRGLGIAALFAGPSGTGKTLAAEVLANELGLDLYRIDLATVVSKYIGETEKNLRRVFEAAEDTGAILLFDEADALFGKRSEVKDSHDRYANIEVSYLLQRMEAYSGLAILSTNAKAALDRAFQRRLRFVVPFPFPDARQRSDIWRRAFPVSTPTADLDYERLGRLDIAGGTIANVALRAAFRAARTATPVGMDDVAAAARDEYGKLDRAWTGAELGGRA